MITNEYLTIFSKCLSRLQGSIFSLGIVQDEITDLVGLVVGLDEGGYVEVEDVPNQAAIDQRPEDVHCASSQLKSIHHIIYSFLGPLHKESV